MAGSFSDYEGVKPAPKGTFADYTPPPPPSAFETSLQTIGDLAAGVKRGMESIAEGGAQSALQLGSLVTGIDSKAPQDALERLRAERIGEYQPSADRSPVASGIGEFVGGAAAGAITSGAASALGAAAGTPALVTSTAGKVAAGVLGSGVSGAGLTYGTPTEKATAGVIGGALTGAGKLIGAKNAAAKALVGNVDDVKARVDNAKQFGQTLTVGQALDSQGIQTAEKALSEVPIVGTKGAFNRQLAGAKDASTKVVQGLNTITEESVDDAYKQFGDLAAATNKPVPLSNVQNVVRDIQGELTIGGKEYKGLGASKLESLVKQLPQTSELNPMEANKFQKLFKKTLDGINPKDLTSKAQVMSIKDAFDADLESYAKAQGSGIFDAFSTAKSLHSQRMAGETLQGILDDSISKQSGKLDPLAFTRALATNSKELKKTLPEKDFKVLQGLQSYLQTANQGVSIGKSQSMGLKSLVLGGLGSMAYFNPVHAAVTGGAAKIAGSVLTSPKTVDLLLKLASAKPGSPIEGAIKRAISRGITTEIGKSTAESE